MDEETFDLTVIGSGPGGYIAALRAAELGLKTAIIEKNANVGGTCLNVGCIPSKALLQSTEEYERIKKRGPELGIEATSLSYNFPQMMKRKGEVVEGLVRTVASLLQSHKVVRFEGHARFITPTMVEVVNGRDKKLVKSTHFIIATGSESIRLPFLPIDELRVVTSTGALELKEVPKRMTVIGAGVIGVELASVYQRLGTEVVIVEMLDRICPMMDAAISRSLLQILKKQGMVFHLSARVKSGALSNGRVILDVEEIGEIESDVCLVAVGRKPYTEGLGLKEIGVSLDEKGFIPVDHAFRTSIQSIYAIGDCIFGPMLAHRASSEGVAAAEIIAGNDAKVNYITIPNVIYTHPEVASVGLTEDECRQAGLSFNLGTYQIRGNARARCAGDLEGLVKVIGEKTTGKLLGIHIIGPHASEMVALGSLALEKGVTLKEMGNLCVAHPTLTEAIKDASTLASI